MNKVDNMLFYDVSFKLLLFEQKMQDTIFFVNKQLERKEPLEAEVYGVGECFPCQEITAVSVLQLVSVYICEYVCVQKK